MLQRETEIIWSAHDSNSKLKFSMYVRVARFYSILIWHCLYCSVYRFTALLVAFIL